LATTEQRGAVAEALLGYLAGRFEVAIICLVRDALVIGWKGFGPDLDDDRIETLLVPLDTPSIFEDACASREVVRGAATPTTLHDHLFKVLRCHRPACSAVIPVAIGSRTVNVLYAHHADGAPILGEEAERLRGLDRAPGDAYFRLIAEPKRRRAATVS